MKNVFCNFCSICCVVERLRCSLLCTESAALRVGRMFVRVSLLLLCKCVWLNACVCACGVTSVVLLSVIAAVVSAVKLRMCCF